MKNNKKKEEWFQKELESVVQPEELVEEPVESDDDDETDIAGLKIPHIPIFLY